MNILYLAHRIPYPPDKGDKIRSYHQLRHLADRHDVWCAFFVDDPHDSVHVDALKQWCRMVAPIPLNPKTATLRGLIGLACGRSLSQAYFDDPRMRRVLADWSRETLFDSAVIYSSGMASYKRAIRAERFILDFCDWDSLKWRSYAERSRAPMDRLYELESRRLQAMESNHLNEFDACVVATQAEADALADAAVRERLHVIGNGVDLPAREPLPADRAPHRVGFVGQMDYRPNVDAVRWFADAVWPKVSADVPDATFHIVGRSPTREVRSLADRPGIVVTGAVADVLPHLEQFAVSVAPLRMGRGIQNKVLEAMAAARPVVLTSVAAAGIETASEAPFIIADDPTGFRTSVTRLLRERQSRSTLGIAARAFVQTQYRWAERMSVFETVCSPRDSNAGIRESHLV